MRAKTPAFHICPAPGCYVEVSNAIFCCPKDWERLSWGARTAIVNTRYSNTLTRERLAALRMARKDWDKWTTAPSAVTSDSGDC